MGIVIHDQYLIGLSHKAFGSKCKVQKLLIPLLSVGVLHQSYGMHLTVHTYGSCERE